MRVSVLNFVLIFTKVDLLKEKLNIFEEVGENLNEYFPELNLGYNYQNAFESIMLYIKDMFLNSLSVEHRQQISCHFMNMVNPLSFQDHFRNIIDDTISSMQSEHLKV